MPHPPSPGRLAPDPHAPAGQTPTPGSPGHIPVLLEAVLDTLDPRPGQVAFDGTVGLGGHARAILARLGPGVLAFGDVDADNLRRAAATIADDAARLAQHAGHAPARLEGFHASFAAAPAELAARGLVADLVLVDLGFASNQMADPARGFSFMLDGPLDMRLDPSRGRTAARLIAEAPEDELAAIITEFGEERFARVIARRIVQARAREPIATTAQLADLVRRAIPRPPKGGIDPATRTFQALRIAVNDELGHLGAFLDAVTDAAHAHQRVPCPTTPTSLPPADPAASPADPRPWLAPGARVGVISFHSLEDRAVKRAFGALVEAGAARDLCPDGPRVAGEAEVRANPRSRSAKLRVIQLAAPAPA